MHMRWNDNRLLPKRTGVTLIELLIVVGLLTILATISLTSVKGLLKDQKVTQAARLVEQYVQTAKIRAITNGRPVAVFLERAQLNGQPDPTNPTGPPVFPAPGNYTATRLSIGEVFPPYSGDVIGATGTLWDVDMTSNSASPTPPGVVTASDIAARFADGFADQIRFTQTDVFSGFGDGTVANQGFISPGDGIQFEGVNRVFVIERIDPVQGSVPPEVAVTFFNPPAPAAYNPIYAASAPDPLLPSVSTQAPMLPVNYAQSPVLAGIFQATPTTTAPEQTTFRVFRKPTKSLVGAITLPRGTCVDLFASGVGSAGSAADGVSPFYTAVAPAAPAIANGLSVNRSSFSRVALVFDATGKPAGMFRDDKIVTPAGTTTDFSSFGIPSKLYLMVGRTDQVLLGADALVVPADGETDQVRSNVLDPANTWISINPLTGLVSSSPVNGVADADLNAAVANGNNYGSVVSIARTLANVGVNNAGQ